MVCNVVGFDDSELSVGFTELKSQLYVQCFIYNHIFDFSTLPKSSFLVFLTTSAFFSIRHGFTSAACTPLCHVKGEQP